MNKVALIVVLLLLTSCCTTKITLFESYPLTIGPFLEGWGRPDSIIPISDRLTRLTWGPNEIVVDRRTVRKASSKDTSITNVKVITFVFVIEEPNLNADVYKSVEEKRMSEEERQLLLFMLRLKPDVNENAIIPDTYPTRRTKYGINEDAIIQQSSELHFTDFKNWPGVHNDQYGRPVRK